MRQNFLQGVLPLNIGKLILVAIFIFSVVVPLSAEEKGDEQATPSAPSSPPPASKEVEVKKPKEEGLVIGKNLTVGMPLERAYNLLGTPQAVLVARGLAPEYDSIFVNYNEAGVVIYSLTGRTVVEEIEALPTFQGAFDKGLKLGDNISKLISLYGVPDEFSDKIARYPDKGMFFFLKGEILVSAKWFLKGTKIFDRELIGQ
jgi:hypothetical protein